MTSKVTSPSQGPQTASSRYQPPSFWRSRVFRVVYLTPLALCWVASIAYLAVGGVFTVTAFVENVLLGVLWVGVHLLIFAYYAWRYGCTSTVIPCISVTWYKVYTLAVFTLFTVLLILSAIETTRTPCGKYSTYNPTDMFDSVCGSQGAQKGDLKVE
jgi:hypothetical protein